MEDKILYTALKRYFNLISQTGYACDSLVHSLFILKYLLWCIKNEVWQKDTEKQYVYQVLDCISDSSCLIDLTDQCCTCNN